MNLLPFSKVWGEKNGQLNKSGKFYFMSNLLSNIFWALSRLIFKHLFFTDLFATVLFIQYFGSARDNN